LTNSIFIKNIQQQRRKNTQSACVSEVTDSIRIHRGKRRFKTKLEKKTILFFANTLSS